MPPTSYYTNLCLLSRQSFLFLDDCIFSMYLTTAGTFHICCPKNKNQQKKCLLKSWKHFKFKDKGQEKHIILIVSKHFPCQFFALPSFMGKIFLNLIHAAENICNCLLLALRPLLLLLCSTRLDIPCKNCLK